MGQLVGQHRLLLLDAHPVEHVDGLGLGVVVGLDLFLEQRQQEGLEGEVAVQQAEFLEYDFAALHALGALVFVELLFQIAFDGGAGGDLALDLALDGQAGLVGGEFDQLIDQREELARLLGGDLGWRRGLRLRRGHLRCGQLRLRRGHLRCGQLRLRRGCGGRLLSRRHGCRKTQRRRQDPSSKLFHAAGSSILPIFFQGYNQDAAWCAIFSGKLCLNRQKRSPMTETDIPQPSGH